MSNQRVRLQLVSTLTIAFILFSVLIAALISCNPSPAGKAQFPDDRQMAVYGDPVRLNVDTTTIFLSDFFKEPSAVEAISIDAGGIEAALSDGSVQISVAGNAPALAALHITVNGFPRTILLRRSKLKLYTFEFDPQGKEYRTVQVKGEMNAWNVNANKLEESDGIYRTEMLLEPKEYQYCMVLDGKDRTDPTNPDSTSNGLGGFNSVLAPFGEGDPAPLRLYTTEARGGRIELRASRAPDGVFVLWNNFMLTPDVDGSTVSFEVPADALNTERSYIRAYAYSGNSLSNDVLIPLHRGGVITAADQLRRMDKHAMVLYNVFVDRFNNGNPANDRPLNIPEVHPRADFHGGDISGATAKINDGYFQELGVNTIWLSPIVKNVAGPWGLWPEPRTEFSAYHGYWPISFTEIDDHMGTPEDLHELVGSAHDQELNVLLDFVANHVHKNHPFYQADTTIATDLYLPDGRLNTELWDEQRLTTWFDVFLPSLRLDDPRVYETLTDSAVYWIKEYNLDGFRHDATKHVPEIFWRTLTRKLKDEVILRENRDIYQIGETYGTRELVGSYVNAGQLDAQFDFNVYDAMVAALTRGDGSFTDLNDAVFASLDMFGHHHLMGNITGNQDRGRFISYAGGALRHDENAKAAGWTREVGVGDPVAYRKSELLMGLIATIPGLPVIYYGDEIGSYGGNDPDNRKMMRFEGLNENEAGLLAKTREIFQYRKTSLPLLYGDMRTHLETGDAWAYSRNYFDQRVLVVFNKSNEARELEFELDRDQSAGSADAAFGSEVELEDRKFRIALPANSFDIIRLN